jgi:hypothetical protein
LAKNTPFSTFTGTYSFKIWLGFTVTSPKINFQPTLEVKFSLVAAILSVSLNVLLAIMLVGRLLWLGHKYRRAFGNSSKIYTYTSPAAMIVESAALYTVPQLMGNVMIFVSQANQNYAIPGDLAHITVVSASSFMTNKRI